MPFETRSIAMWITCALTALPLRAEERDADVPTLEVAGSLAIPAIAAPRAALSPDGKRLAAPLADDRLAVWNLASGERVMETKEGHGWQIFGIAFSPDGQRIATASADKTAKLWEANTGKLLATLEGHTDRLKYLVYSPKGKYLLTSTGKTWPYEKYGSVEARVWDAETGELVAELKGHDHTITRAEFSRDETRVFTASDDHTVRVWDAASGVQQHEFDLGAKVESMDVAPDGKTILASSSGDRNSYAKTESRRRPDAQPPAPEPVVKLWDSTTGKELLSLALQPGVPDEQHLSHRDVRASFNEDGDQILTERQGRITYWDKATGKQLAVLREPFVPSTKLSPTTVIFSPRGDFLVVLKRDQAAELWNVADRKKVREMDVPFRPNAFPMDHSRFFSPDGRTFYSLQSGHARESGDFRWWSLDGLE